MVVLQILAITSLPMMFILGCAYFFALRVYRDQLVIFHPDIWADERMRSRPLESWVQPSYRLLVRTKQGMIGDLAICKEVVSARSRAVKLLYATATCCMTFLIASLLLETMM